MPTVHLIIKGRVQGVFYRATAKEIADKIGIKGWVRNTEEGNVEAIATGSREQLQKFIEWCREGRPKAIVVDVVITAKQDEAFDKFRVMR